MISLDARQTAIMSASGKYVDWLFTVTSSSGQVYRVYRWSTKRVDRVTDMAWSGVNWSGVSWAGATEESYLFKVIKFDGVTMRRPKSEHAIIAPNQLTFTISNINNALSPADFEGGRVFLVLQVSAGGDTAVIRRWKFDIKKAEPGYQEMRIICADFLSRHLAGDYPNTPYADDVFPTSNIDKGDSLCIPQPFGTCYIPCKYTVVTDPDPIEDETINFLSDPVTGEGIIYGQISVLGSLRGASSITVSGATDAENNGTFKIKYITDDGAGEVKCYLEDGAGIVTRAMDTGVSIDQDKPAYLLGPYVVNGESVTYAIDEVRTPSGYEISRWQGSRTEQIRATDAGGKEWVAFQAYLNRSFITNSWDNPGYFKSGNSFQDLPARFSRSDTANMTNFADVIRFVLLDIGVSAADINDDSFYSAGQTYDSWGLVCEGAFFEKMSREKALSMLLNLCHSTILSTDQIYLKVLSKTSQMVIVPGDVIKKAGSDKGTFEYRASTNQTTHDAGYVHWTKGGELQSEFIKTITPAKASTGSISGEILKVPFVHDTQNIQRIGALNFQRKYLQDGTILCLGKSRLILLDPDDMATINGSNYGGNYPVLVDEMTIRPDISVDIKAINYSDYLDDWEDLSPAAVTSSPNDAWQYWTTVVAGPKSDESVGRSAFEVWGNPYIVVGPNELMAKYTDIQAALNALKETSHSGIYILDGAYYPADPLNFPDRDIELRGESQNVIIYKPGMYDAMIFDETSARYLIEAITIASPITGLGGTAHINVKGAAANLSDLTISRVNFVLSESLDDTGIDSVLAAGCLRVFDCDFRNGECHINASTDNMYLKRNTHYCSSLTDIAIALYAPDDENQVEVAGNVLNGVWRYGINAAVPGGKFTANKVNFALSGLAANAAGIMIQSDESIVMQNEVKAQITQASSDQIFGIALTQYASGTQCSNNRINLGVNTSNAVAGIYSDHDHGILSGNKVVVQNANTSPFYRYGFYLIGKGNTVTSNHTEMANNSMDTGFYLSAGTSDNDGAGNITKDVTTSVNDAGTNNSVTAKDI